MRTAPVVAALLLLTASPLIAQSEWQRNVPLGAPVVGGRVATRDDFVRFQSGRGLEVVPVVTVAGAMVGSIGILAARLFYLGFLVVAPCDIPCEGDAARPFAHFPKYETIGAAIGVGAGFILGVVLYLGQRRQGEAGGKERRVSATVVPQRDGRFGFGASVRF